MGHVSAPENRSRKNSRALTDKTLSRSPPPPRRGYGETAFAPDERLAENVASPTGWPSRSSPRRGERRLAERVGFVPDNLAPINDLGPIGNSKSAKSTRNLSIRYKTGTPQIDNCLRRADVRRRTVRRPTPSLAGTAVGRVRGPILPTCSIAATGGRSPRARASSPRRAASPTPDRPVKCAAHPARAAA